MNTSYNFKLYSPEYADGLKDLLGDTILPSLNMSLDGAAARDDLEDIHFGELSILSDTSVVGQYKFRRINRVYECSVSGEGMHPEIYKQLLRQIG